MLKTAEYGQMPQLWNVLQRVWRGAWKPTYKPFTGWWYLLDLPYRLREVFCAIFLGARRGKLTP